METPRNSNEHSEEPWALIADSSWLAGQQFAIPTNGAIIGRGQNCDIVIPGNHLSRQHAQIQIRGHKAIIRDLGSANGTFVNDKRISQCVITPGDHVRLDVYSFRFTGPSQVAGETLLRSEAITDNAATAASGNQAASGDAKTWITKPTSPGNREEPPADTGSSLVMPIALGLCALMLGTIGYIVISRL